VLDHRGFTVLLDLLKYYFKNSFIPHCKKVFFHFNKNLLTLLQKKTQQTYCLYNWQGEILVVIEKKLNNHFLLKQQILNQQIHVVIFFWHFYSAISDTYQIFHHTFCFEEKHRSMCNLVSQSLSWYIWKKFSSKCTLNVTTRNMRQLKS